MRSLFLATVLFAETLTRSFLKKRCSEIIEQIYKRTPMPKCDLSKVAKELH